MRLDPKDRFCILLIDESPVEVKNVPKSKLTDEQTPPSHVINFMLRGVYRHWKLPISNIFWSRQGSGSGSIFGEAIKTIITNICRSGLSVIATVSDHSKININAINYLTKKPENDSYIVGYNRVFHVYDPCSLLKSVRNNLVKNDLIFEMDGVKKIASWKHITSMFNIDFEKGKERKLTKIGLLHVCPKFYDKMNTSYCAQVFSETYSNEIRNAVEMSKYIFNKFKTIFNIFLDIK